jgi:hypothetical protein
MAKKVLYLFAGGLMAAFVAVPGAWAQMVVHAVSGTVKAVQPETQTVEVAVDPNSTSRFKLAENSKAPLEFDSELRADATDPAKFGHVGDYAVVYYYGYDDNRTAVAMKDLGPGPFTKVEGTVTGFDKHNRTVTLKDDSGKTVALKLDDHLVVDTDMSVDSGRHYSPHKGDRVRVTYTAANGANDAVFFHDLR